LNQKAGFTKRPFDHNRLNMAFFIKSINDAVKSSFVGRYFELEERKATFFGELRGATATFMSMAYILAVNPRILADSGGPCEGEGYDDCIIQIRREYVTATALGSIAGTLLMGLMANLPIAMAPGVSVFFVGRILVCPCHVHLIAL
jgi:adenine/guanine/hypoxanthine permease